MCDLSPRQVYYLALPWGPEFAISWAAWCAGLPVTHIAKGKPERIRWTLPEVCHLAELLYRSRAGRVPS